MSHVADVTHAFSFNDGPVSEASRWSLREMIDTYEAEERERTAREPFGNLLDRLDPTSRIVQALEHAERQRLCNPHDGSLQEALWAFQPFRLTVGELLLAALAGVAPKHPRAQAYRIVHHGRGLQERLQQAQAHVEHHGQGHQALWPYQRFSLTLDELLRAALQSS